MYRHVIQSIARRWFEIGIELFEGDTEDEETLFMIKENNLHDVVQCTAEMLKYWLKRKPEASWNMLLEALKIPYLQLDDLASQIEAQLIKGMFLHNIICSYVTYFTDIWEKFELKIFLLLV